MTDTTTLKEALDKSSNINRVLGLSFALFLFYVLNNVASTTDLMLLIPDSSFKLPLLNIELPLFEFYLVTPLLILVFHFNLLFNLQQHVIKLKSWVSLVDEKEVKLLLFPFLFNNTAVRHKFVQKTVLKLVVRLFIFLLPLSSLIIIQIRFSDYQSWAVTSWHGLAVLLDYLLIIFYSGQLLNDGHNSRRSIRNWFGFDVRSKLRFIEIPIQLVRSMPLFIVLITTAFFSTLMLCVLRPDKLILLIVRSLFNKKASVLSFLRLNFLYAFNVSHRFRLELLGVMIAVGSFVLFALTLQGSFSRDYVHQRGYIMPCLDVQEEKIVKNEPLSDIIKLDLAGKEEEIRELRLKFSEGYDLRNRNFLYADFSKSDFTNADFRNSNFDYCLMHKTTLDGGKMKNGSLNYADFRDANLFKVTVQFCEAKHMNFNSAKLSLAHFSDTDMRNCNFTNADIREASFFDSDLMYGDFTTSSAQGVGFDNSNLSNSYFAYTQLIGAHFTLVTLRGAIFEKARMVGTISWHSDFSGASFAYVNFSGANFVGSELDGVQLYHVDFIGSTLDDVSFNGAILNQVDFRKTILKDSSSYMVYKEGERFKTNVDSLFSEENIKRYAERIVFPVGQERFIARLRNVGEGLKDRTNDIGGNEFEVISRKDNHAFLLLRREVASKHSGIAAGMIFPFVKYEEGQMLLTDTLGADLYHFIQNNPNYPVETLQKKLETLREIGGEWKSIDELPVPTSGPFY